MPELPEVETIRLGLEKYVVGHVIFDVEVRLARIFSGDVKDIIGAKIIGVRRFGKGLVIDLDNDFSMAVHVKMTGQLIYKRVSRVSKVSGVSSAGKHTHVVFKLGVENDAIPSEVKRSRGISHHKVSSLNEIPRLPSVARDDNVSAHLFYNDIRQFGWLKVIATKEVSKLPFFASLGLEPLKDLTLESFSQILKNSRIAIKLLLMDQKKIAGVGNIYANDALYIAKIYPKRSASNLSEREVKELFNSIEYVLKKGITAGGASEWNYVDVLGGKGKYQDFFQVYQKDGKLCKRCGTIIEKINVGGRGTFFCPTCQK